MQRQVKETPRHRGRNKWGAESHKMSLGPWPLILPVLGEISTSMVTCPSISKLICDLQWMAQSES